VGERDTRRLAGELDGVSLRPPDRLTRPFQ
jgi:hypothetical protein